MRKIFIIVSIVTACTTNPAAEIPELEEPLVQKDSPKPLGTEKSTVDMINKITKLNNIFSTKITDHLLPRKIIDWQERGIIRYPTKLVSWNNFKKDIHQLSAYLEMLVAKDPQSNSYYHIETLRKNHELYKMLENLEHALITYEPKIEYTQPLKLKKSSLEAMQHLIDTYGTRFYQDKLLEMLAKTLNLFEKKAKKIRAEQEQLQKNAQKKAYQSPEFDIFSEDLGSDFYQEPMDETINFEGINFGDNFIQDFFK